MNRFARSIALGAVLALTMTGFSTVAAHAAGTLQGSGYVRDDYFSTTVAGTVQAYTQNPATNPAAVAEQTVPMSLVDGGFNFTTLVAGPTWLKITPTNTAANSVKIVGPYAFDDGYFFSQISLPTNRGVVAGQVQTSDGDGFDCAVLDFQRIDDQSISSTTYTQDEGVFKRMMPIGSYKLRVSDDCDNSFDPFYVGIPGATFDTATTFVIPTTGQLDIPTITVPAQKSISGTVTSDAIVGVPSAPIAGIDVSALAYNADGGYWESWSDALTNASGNYVLRDLPPGAYKLQFSDPDGDFQGEYYDNVQTAPEDAADVTIDATSVTGKNASLGLNEVTTDGELLAGFVKDSAGHGIASIGVSLFNVGQSQYVDNANTNRLGRFSFRYLEPGDYELYYYDYDSDRYIIDDNLPTKVTIGATKGADVTKVLKTFSSVSGHVTIAATTAPHIDETSVALYDVDDNYVTDTSVSPDGTYSLARLQPGTYRARFDGQRELSQSRQIMIRQFWSGKYSLASATSVAVASEAHVVNINALLGSKLICIAAPKTSGTAKKGYTLKATTGTWNAKVGTTFAYQWYRGTTAISGATKNAYKLTSSDVGKYLKVKVTATNTVNHYTSGLSYSKLTAKILS